MFGGDSIDSKEIALTIPPQPLISEIILRLVRLTINTIRRTPKAVFSWVFVTVDMSSKTGVTLKVSSVSMEK